MRNPLKNPKPGDILIDDSDDYECMIVTCVSQENVYVTTVVKCLDTNEYYTNVNEEIHIDEWKNLTYCNVLHIREEI